MRQNKQLHKVGYLFTASFLCIGLSLYLIFTQYIPTRSEGISSALKDFIIALIGASDKDEACRIIEERKNELGENYESFKKNLECQEPKQPDSIPSGSEITDIQEHINSINRSVGLDFDTGFPDIQENVAKQYLDDLKSQSPEVQNLIKELLDGEKKLKTEVAGLVRYLNTAWLWYEATSGYPDVYAVNCDDIENLKRPSIHCNKPDSGDYQVAGYQVADRKNNFRTIAEKCFDSLDDSNLRSILQKVVSNSTLATRKTWNYYEEYKATSVNNNLVRKYLQNMDSNASNIPSDVTYTNDIGQGNEIITNERIQFYTVLLGKHPCMVTGLNSYAVSGQKKMIAEGTGWASYVNQQRLSNLMAALWMFETGKDDINPLMPGPTGDIPEGANAKILYYAEQISSLIEKCKAYGNYSGYCRHVNLYSNSSFTSTKRLGEAYVGNGSERDAYWCATYTSDAINLAITEMGNPSITTTNGVVGQLALLRTKNFSFLEHFKDKKPSLEQVKPGCTVSFMRVPYSHTSGSQHVAVLKEKNINNNGDGYIITLDSNHSKKENKYTITNWNILNPVWENVVFACLNE